MQGNMFKPAPKGTTLGGTAKELAMDIGDVAYDIPAGVAQSAATAVGGIYGGGVPGGMAAGGLSGAAIEAGRQKLGQMAGLQQDISGKDVAISGAMGAVSPVVFGTGAQGVKSLTPELQNLQRSLITRGVGKIFPTIARGTSGIPKEAIKTYMANRPEIDAMIAEGPDAAAKLSTTTNEQIHSLISGKKSEIGQDLRKQITGSPNVVNRDNIFLPIENEITDLVNSELSHTPAGQAKISKYRAGVDAMKIGLPEQIQPETAWKLKDDLYQMSQYNSAASKDEKSFAKAAQKSYHAANNELQTAANSAGKSKEYSALSSVEEQAGKYFGDPAKTERTLMQLDAPSKGQTRILLDKLEELVGPTKVRENAKKILAYKEFQNPELLPKSGGGTTSTSRSLSLMSGLGSIGSMFGEGGRKVGEAVGTVAGGPMATKFAISKGQDIAKKVGGKMALSSPWLNLGTKEWLKSQQGEK
jgi:hypothetical protein